MKVEIINSDNIDGLYSRRINELIDSYFSENISAISLSRYLKKGSKDYVGDYKGFFIFQKD